MTKPTPTLRNEPTRQVVDLLYEEPQTRVRLETLERALSFAFSSGDTGGLFERALEHAQMGQSCFDPQCFAHDLFIEEFVERCLQQPGATARSPGASYVKHALCHPPLHLSTTRMRQAIVRELLDDRALREHLERTYREMVSLRSLLSPTSSGSRYDMNQRRIDVLRSIQTVVELLCERFDGAASELRRLGRFAARTRQSEAFRRLEELLTYERNVATLDLRVHVGMDGRIRGFDLLGIRENVTSPFYSSWFGRWWTKLVLLLRGYRIGEQEVFGRLTDQVFEGLKHELLQVFQLIGDFEFYLAGLSLFDLARTQNLAVCLPDFSDDSGTRLVQLFNPFLVAEGITVRPCDVDAQRPDAMIIVTGPNSGGKTRLLQAIALCQLLGQAGLPIPTKSATLCWTRNMFVSLVQETSADQREGRLGTELLRIRRLFEQVAPGDLVILDELCSGTNQSEGEEIFRLVIELLAELRPQLWLTTHFLQFAERLQQEHGIDCLSFLQVELDAGEHPTYQFVPGVAHSSLARQTAARLGVTWQELKELVERAKQRPSKNASP